MEELRESLIKFQSLTAALINTLKKEDYDSLDEIFNEREEIITAVKKLQYTSEDFRDISLELRLSELEEALNKLLAEKRQMVREQMNNLRNSKKANNNYQRNFQPDSLFFSKKI